MPQREIHSVVARLPSLVQSNIPRVFQVTDQADHAMVHSTSDISGKNSESTEFANFQRQPSLLSLQRQILHISTYQSAGMGDFSVTRKRVPTVDIGLPKSVPSVNGSVSSFSSLQPLLPQSNLPVTRDPSKSSPHGQVAPYIKRGMARGISSFKPKIGAGDVSAVGNSIVLKPALKKQWSSADVNSKKLLNQLSALSLGPAPIKTPNIGVYDGKLEMDLKQRAKSGEKKIVGEAGEILKLSSSQSKSVKCFTCFVLH